MKKLAVILMSLGITFGAAAQAGHVVAGGFHGGGYAVYPRVSVGVGFYPPFYSPFGYYPYWTYPYGAYGPYSKPSKLDNKIQSIRSDYADRIYSARHDTSLTGKERRQTVRSLKQQRDKDIKDLVENYHKQPVTR
jgi:hypothetical protein